MIIDFSNKETIYFIVYVLMFILIIIFIVLLFRANSRYKRLFNEYKKLKLHNDELDSEISNLKALNASLNVKKDELDELKPKYDEVLEKFHSAKEEIARLNTKLQEQEESFKDKIEFLRSSEERLKESFENIASSILDNTNQKLQKVSKESLETILNPLQGQIKEFKERIERLSQEEAKERGALFNELKSLKELNQRLSNEANNLTKALSGESKTQGIWGEMVLEKVLEMSGLREGIEYKREVSLQDNSNQKYRPDVIVYLPQNREVIIDAKTSLRAYKEYINASDENLKKAFLKEHIKSIKNHINLLSQKRYEELKGIKSLDFVLLFVPIENALLVALNEDSNLFEYAFKKRIILVSPTTLLVSLRAIESSWRYERQSEAISEVINNAQNLYEKVRLFVEDFKTIGKSLNMANEAYENAFKKLTTGKGNVIRQIEMLKEKANIKPKKEIPKEFINLN